MDSKAIDSKVDSRADEYRARAAEYDRKAATLGHGNAAIAAYYQSLAKHWRSLALLNENKTEREQTRRRALIFAVIAGADRQSGYARRWRRKSAHYSLRHREPHRHCRVYGRARGGRVVSKSREYQHRATECVRLALAARDQTNKLLLLDMAQCWLTLSEQALTEENAVNAESAESQ